MASKLLPTTPRAKTHTRTVSLDSGGRLAVPKFINGNCVETPQKSLPERRPPRPSNMEKRAIASSKGGEAQDDHSKVKEQLASIERSKSSLMQDLARAKRNVDELTTKLNGVTGPCRKDILRTAEPERTISQDKEGWQVELNAMKQQYELALTELQLSKQAMESLKHELMVCVEAKDEAVRLAGEAMNAAESTARRVEELSAELFTTKGSVPAGGCATLQMDYLIDELPGASKSLFELDVLLAEEKTSQMDDLIGELPPGASECHFEVDAPLAEEKAVMPNVKASAREYSPEPSHNARAEVSDKRTESIEMKDQEIIDHLPPSKDQYSELGASKDTDQKASDDLLAAAQATIQRSKLEAEDAKRAESLACSLLAKVSKELEEAEEKLVRASIEDATLVASLGFLKAQLKGSQLELMEAQGRETEASSKLAELTECMSNMRQESQVELVMYKQRETSTLAKIETLEMELVKCRSELVMMAERESVAAAKVANMIEEIKKSQSELIEVRKHSTQEVAALRAKLEEKEGKLVTLEERELIGANKIMALTLELNTKHIEVGDLRQQLLQMESKAEAVSTELSVLQEKGIHLAAAREEEVTALKGEVLKLQKDMDAALKLGQGAREDVNRLENTLQQAILDRDEARCKVETAYRQLECSERKSEDVLAETQASKKELERALEDMRTASSAAMEKLIMASKLAKEEAQVACEEAGVAEERLQTERKQIEIARVEMENISKEVQSARQDAEFHRAALRAGKERANVIEEEARAVFNEVVKLRSELTKSQADAEEAKAAWADAESRLQDSRNELEAQKVSAMQAERQASELCQGELTCLKEKLRGCDEQLHVATSEVEALQTDKAKLLSELETVKVEREASNRAVMEAHQHLADLEKAKRVMEADIQRLLDDSKLWRAPKDARDILVLSEINGNGILPLDTDSREEKPQPESPDREGVQDLDMAGLLMDREESKEEVHGENGQETRTAMEETPSRAAKKKKPALLHRLHSYLDKKKSASA